MTTDPIADFLTRIRNASSVGLKTVEIPASNTKRAMTQILFDQCYILNYKVEEDNKQGIIKIALKYKEIADILKINSWKRCGIHLTHHLINSIHYIFHIGFTEIIPV